jgi:hypothetical protein
MMYFTDPRECGYCQNNGITDSEFDEDGNCTRCHPLLLQRLKDEEITRKFFEEIRTRKLTGKEATS